VCKKQRQAEGEKEGEGKGGEERGRKTNEKVGRRNK
jgi:hypothetical protein